jgi:hypothetical protein
MNESTMAAADRGGDEGAERCDERTLRPVIASRGGTAARAEATERSARALRLAGLALAPEHSELRDPRLACLLLREALVAVARAITGTETLRSAGDARAALAGHADLPPSLRSSRALVSHFALEGETPPTLDELLELETTLGELVRFARQEPPPRLGPAWRRAAALLVAALAVIVVPRAFEKPVWAKYSWQASSTSEGFPSRGTLDTPERGLLFHTGREPGPSLLIDMKQPRSVSRIVIRNRQDCCFERGLPLVVEVGSSVGSLARVGRQTTVFDEWTVDFAAREARYVRLRSEADTYLHLSEIAIP